MSLVVGLIPDLRPSPHPVSNLRWPWHPPQALRARQLGLGDPLLLIFSCRRSVLVLADGLHSSGVSLLFSPVSGNKGSGATEGLTTQGSYVSVLPYRARRAPMQVVRYDASLCLPPLASPHLLNLCATFLIEPPDRNTQYWIMKGLI